MKPFIIGDELKSIIIKKGQTISYDITFGGEPPPTPVWEHDETPIVANDRITIDKTEKTTALTVKKAVRGDSGKYRLLLSNSSGTIATTAEVVVLGKAVVWSHLSPNLDSPSPCHSMSVI